MKVLSRFRRPSRVPLPEDMTAAVETLFTDWPGEGGFALTGYPEYLGVQTDGDGIRYARIRFGFGPDAHVIIRTPMGKYCAFGAEAFMAAHEDLHPLPSEMGDAA